MQPSLKIVPIRPPRKKDANHLAILTCAIGAVLLAAFLWVSAARESPDQADQLLLSRQLPNVPGKKINAVVITYPPGGNGKTLRAKGSVFAYVLNGTIESRDIQTGSVNTYHPSDSFFEPPEPAHLVLKNPSKAVAANVLAVTVDDDDSQILP